MQLSNGHKAFALTILLTEIMNEMLNYTKKSCEIDELVREMASDGQPLLYHSEVMWLFHRRVIGRVWNLRQELLYVV